MLKRWCTEHYFSWGCHLPHNFVASQVARKRNQYKTLWNKNVCQWFSCSKRCNKCISKFAIITAAMLYQDLSRRCYTKKCFKQLALQRCKFIVWQVAQSLHCLVSQQTRFHAACHVFLFETDFPSRLIKQHTCMDFLGNCKDIWLASSPTQTLLGLVTQSSPTRLTAGERKWLLS